MSDKQRELSTKNVIKIIYDGKQVFAMVNGDIVDVIDVPVTTVKYKTDDGQECSVDINQANAIANTLFTGLNKVVFDDK